MTFDKARAAKIAELNDELRISTFDAAASQNKIMVAGELGSDVEMVARVLRAAAAFKDFNADNDPYGEHDCASFDVHGVRCLFKIDYYDLNLEWHSPDPTDPKVTRRVMTVMYARDY